MTPSGPRVIRKDQTHVRQSRYVFPGSTRSKPSWIKRQTVGAQWELRCPLTRADQSCTGAMGVAARPGARRPAFRTRLVRSAGTGRPTPAPLAECREGPFRLFLEPAPAAGVPDGKIGLS